MNHLHKILIILFFKLYIINTRLNYDAGLVLRRSTSARPVSMLGTAHRRFSRAALMQYTMHGTLALCLHPTRLRCCCKTSIRTECTTNTSHVLYWQSPNVQPPNAAKATRVVPPMIAAQPLFCGHFILKDSFSVISNIFKFPPSFSLLPSSRFLAFSPSFILSFLPAVLACVTRTLRLVPLHTIPATPLQLRWLHTIARACICVLGMLNGETRTKRCRSS